MSGAASAILTNQFPCPPMLLPRQVQSDNTFSVMRAQRTPAISILRSNFHHFMRLGHPTPLLIP